MCCDECLKIQEQMELLSSIQIRQDKIDAQEAIDDELMVVGDSFKDQAEESFANTPVDITENIHKNINCPSSRTRLSLLKGITIIEQKGKLQISMRAIAMKTAIIATYHKSLFY